MKKVNTLLLIFTLILTLTSLYLYHISPRCASPCEGSVDTPTNVCVMLCIFKPHPLLPYTLISLVTTVAILIFYNLIVFIYRKYRTVS